MKRFEIFVIALLSVLAGFVGHEVVGVRKPHQLRYVAGRVGESLLTAHAGTVANGGNVITAVRAPVPERALMDVQRRLLRGAAGTYIGEVLLARDSALARWPDHRLRPLKVWVEPSLDNPNWNPAYVGLAEQAFREWSATGIPLRFSFVSDSAKADVHLTWTDRFDEPISGKTLWARDDSYWIVEANIVLALHHSNGEPLDTAAIHAIALHEVGHLIGLDHTADTLNIMTPRVRVRDLSPIDRATAQLLYMLPPGAVGRGSSAEH